MKLEKFRNLNKRKITIICSIILVFILLIGIIIYESYALYEEKKSFNVLNGTVPEFGSYTGKIELAYTIDGTSSNKFPGKNDGYGAKNVVCDAGVTASWNDVAWSLEINDPKNQEKIKCTVNFIKTKIYGVERVLSSSSSAWTRTNDAIGLVANAQFGSSAVRNDFDGIYPWSDIKSYNYNTSTKKITAWYGDSNFKFDGTNGEVLTYIPEFYYKRSQDGTKEYIVISKKPLNGYIKSEAFSIGRYMMSGNASGVHSKSGASPFGNDNIVNYRTYAKALGSGFGQLDYHIFLIQLLYLVEYADYNSQVKLGVGNTSNTTIINTGGCNNLGMHSGTLNNDGKNSVIYRGIEDIYGNSFQFIDGINIKDNQAYVCYAQNLYQSDKFDECYQKLGYVNINYAGFSSKIGYDSKNSLIALPTESNGTGSTYITDRNHVSGVGNRVMAIGGYYGYSEKAGMFNLSWAAESTTIIAYGTARLIKIN